MLISKVIVQTDVDIFTNELNKNLQDGWHLRDDIKVQSYFYQGYWHNQYIQVITKNIKRPNPLDSNEN